MITVQVAQRPVLPHGDAQAAEVVVPGGGEHLPAADGDRHFVVRADGARDLAPGLFAHARVGRVSWAVHE